MMIMLLWKDARHVRIIFKDKLTPCDIIYERKAIGLDCQSSISISVASILPSELF